MRRLPSVAEAEAADDVGVFVAGDGKAAEPVVAGPYDGLAEESSASKSIGTSTVGRSQCETGYDIDFHAGCENQIVVKKAPSDKSQ